MVASRLRAHLPARCPTCLCLCLPRSALAKLYTPDGSAPLYPLAFLTNGGGVTERVKAHQLSEWLGVAVDESQVVLSHTPFRQLAAQYAEEPVLVAGRGHVR